MRKEKKPLHWVKLDNAAKIYPAVRQKSWSNLFRQSVTLREEVDVAVLEKALEVVVKRFPSIAARLRKGAFWYYLQQVAEPPKLREEYSYPLVPMGKEEMRKCAFRVIVYKERIAVEFFHALTDGSGAMVFLKNLVAEYLEQNGAGSIPELTPADEKLLADYHEMGMKIGHGGMGETSYLMGICPESVKMDRLGIVSGLSTGETDYLKEAGITIRDGGWNTNYPNALSGHDPVGCNERIGKAAIRLETERLAHAIKVVKEDENLMRWHAEFQKGM